jgi:copper resistance protein C
VLPRRLAAAVAAGLCFLVALALGAPAALAHDVLLRTIPADGSTVPSVPPRITLVFAEPALALGTAIEISGPDGSVAAGNAVLAGSTVSESIRAGAPAGRYLVRWRVTSDDGHPVSGSFSFTASRSGGGSVAATSTGSSGSAGRPGAGGSIIGLVGWALLVAIVLVAVIVGVARFRPGRRREVGIDE